MLDLVRGPLGLLRRPGTLPLFLTAVTFAAVIPAADPAFGQGVDCPTGGLDASTLSQPEKEIRELRNDLALVCAAQADGLQAIEIETAATADGVEQLEGPLVALRDTLDAAAGEDGSLNVLAAVDDEEPVRVYDDASAQALGAPLTVRTETADPLLVADEEHAETSALGYSAMHADVWFLIGITSSLLAAYGLYRVVMPRA